MPGSSFGPVSISRHSMGPVPLVELPAENALIEPYGALGIVRLNVEVYESRHVLAPPRSPKPAAIIGGGAGRANRRRVLRCRVGAGTLGQARGG